METLWRLLIVGGHTGSIGKTQLVCDVIRAFPKAYWVAGRISENDHGDYAENRDCTLHWETQVGTGSDCAPFLTAGAKKSFWLRTKQGNLPEGLQRLRQRLNELQLELLPAQRSALIIESDSLMQFVKPSLFFAVIDPAKEDFAESERNALDRANALVLRSTAVLNPDAPPAPLWMNLPSKLLKEKPSVLQREGEALPRPLEGLVYRMLEEAPGVAV